MKEYFKRLYSEDCQSFYQLVKKNLTHEKKMFIVTTNPESFNYINKDREFKKLMDDKETILVPDGISIVKAARILNIDIKERITGIDLTSELLKECENKKYKLCLLGAKEEVLELLKVKIKEEYPHIRLGTCLNGYTNKEEQDKYFQKIALEKPDVVLCALGIPKQEKIIYQHLSLFDKGIFVGVGGTFDVLSGLKKRAPKLMQKLNLEWLYRIIKEPKRIGRFWRNNVLFIFKVLWLKLRKGKNEYKSK